MATILSVGLLMGVPGLYSMLHIILEDNDRLIAGVGVKVGGGQSIRS